MSMMVHGPSMRFQSSGLSIFSIIGATTVLAIILLALPPTVDGGIHRHTNYTLYPMKIPGRPSPLSQLAKFVPKEARVTTGVKKGSAGSLWTPLPGKTKGKEDGGQGKKKSTSTQPSFHVSSSLTRASPMVRARRMHIMNYLGKRLEMQNEEEHPPEDDSVDASPTFIGRVLETAGSIIRRLWEFPSPGQSQKEKDQERNEFHDRSGPSSHNDPTNPNWSKDVESEVDAKWEFHGLCDYLIARRNYTKENCNETEWWESWQKKAHERTGVNGEDTLGGQLDPQYIDPALLAGQANSSTPLTTEQELSGWDNQDFNATLIGDAWFEELFGRAPKNDTSVIPKDEQDRIDHEGLDLIGGGKGTKDEGEQNEDQDITGTSTPLTGGSTTTPGSEDSEEEAEERELGAMDFDQYVPITTEDDDANDEDDKDLSLLAPTGSSKRAEVTVTKLNLFDAFGWDQHLTRMQEGHVIQLDNPHRHFSFHAPKGGCNATLEEGGLERTSENARRNKCRVATNAGFFNIARGIKNCYNGVITRNGVLVQKQHSRFLSQQFTRNVHFGLTSHGHFFTGYLTQEMWLKHLQVDQKLIKDVNDLTNPVKAGVYGNGRREMHTEAVEGEEGITSSTEFDASTDTSYTLTRIPKSSQTPATLRKLLSHKHNNGNNGGSDKKKAFEPPPMEYETLLTTQNDWTFSTLLGGVLWLVRDGQDYIEQSIIDGEDLTVERTPCTDCPDPGTPKDHHSSYKRDELFIHLTSARTSIGHTLDGSLLIMSIDGKTDSSASKQSRSYPGINLHNLATLMIRAGALNAINLDGGGSATVVVDGVVSNYPSDVQQDRDDTWYKVASSERLVSTITCIHDDEDAPEVPTDTTTTPQTPAHDSGATEASATKNTTNPASPGTMDTHGATQPAAKSGTTATLTTTPVSPGTNSTNSSSTSLSPLPSISTHTNSTTNSTQLAADAAAAAAAEAEADATAKALERDRQREAEAANKQAEADAEAQAAADADREFTASVIKQLLAVVAFFTLLGAAVWYWRQRTSTTPTHSGGFDLVGGADGGGSRRRPKRQVEAGEELSPDFASTELEDPDGALDLEQPPQSRSPPTRVSKTGHSSSFTSSSLDDQDDLSITSPGSSSHPVRNTSRVPIPVALPVALPVTKQHEDSKSKKSKRTGSAQSKSSVGAAPVTVPSTSSLIQPPVDFFNFAPSPSTSLATSPIGEHETNRFELGEFDENEADEGDDFETDFNPRAES